MEVYFQIANLFWRLRIFSHKMDESYSSMQRIEQVPFKSSFSNEQEERNDEGMLLLFVSFFLLFCSAKLSFFSFVLFQKIPIHGT